MIHTRIKQNKTKKRRFTSTPCALPHPNTQLPPLTFPDPTITLCSHPSRRAQQSHPTHTTQKRFKISTLSTAITRKIHTNNNQSPKKFKKTRPRKKSLQRSGKLTKFRSAYHVGRRRKRRRGMGGVEEEEKGVGRDEECEKPLVGRERRKL